MELIASVLSSRARVESNSFLIIVFVSVYLKLEKYQNRVEFEHKFQLKYVPLPLVYRCSLFGPPMADITTGSLTVHHS